MGFEIWAPFGALYRAGDYAAAADQSRPVVEAHPEYAIPLYNLACCESLAGRTETRSSTCGRRSQRSEKVREFARGDSDFDPIRDEPAFKELVGE